MKKISTNGLYVKFFMAICFFFTSFAVSGQSYTGWVTQSANLREGSGTNYKVLETLPAGTQIFIYSITGENNFYKVKVIATDTDGYISKSLVELGNVVMEAKSTEGPLEPIGKTPNDPQIEVFNNTSKRLTLTLNDEKHIFAPKETKTITVPAGRYSYMASVPGVLPYFGNDNIERYIKYRWTFYISEY